MKSGSQVLILFVVCFLLGCQGDYSLTGVDSGGDSESAANKIVDQIVEASCGECQFGMEGDGCDLAVRIDGKSYYVDGSSIDDHGDAHGSDGMCQCVRKARVSGEMNNGRFLSTSFEVLPLEKKEGTDQQK